MVDLGVLHKNENIEQELKVSILEPFHAAMAVLDVYPWNETCFLEVHLSANKLYNIYINIHLHIYVYIYIHLHIYI